MQMLLLKISGMEMKISNEREESIQNQKINAPNINFTHPSQIIALF